jgi:hypothetical protein
MSKMGSYDPFGYLKQKSEIAVIYLSASGIPHTIGKLSMRATTLLQTSLQSKIYIKTL